MEFCKDLRKNFLDNHKNPHYLDIAVKGEDFGCTMDIRVHFLLADLDFFPENLGYVNEEQGKCFLRT